MVTALSIYRGGKKILIGGGHIEQEFTGSRHVFIVCDPFIERSGTVRYLTDRLERIKVAYTVYSDVEPDPGTELVARGISSLAEVQPDVLVGFGGGSAIDACKAMMFFAEKERIIGECRFIAIPTTSGTGSEVTDFSVISDKEKEIKYPLIAPELLPDTAILDAELTMSVPPEITANTGMDVLTHAIEATVSTNAGDFSDAMAEKAIKLVRSNLITAYKNPGDRAARQAMHNASCMAGIAFNNAGLGLNHGMAHALGAHFHVPHGKANAILLPYVTGFNAGCFDNLTEHAKKYAKIARLIHVDAGSIRQSSFNLIRTIKRTNEQLGIPASIMSAGIDRAEFESQLDPMARSALADRCTATNPRGCTAEDIRRIFIHAYFGSVGKRL